MSDHVIVARIPKCDMCEAPAEFDGKTTFGPWANMCGFHFGQFGVGLGTGRGQALELDTASEAEDIMAEAGLNMDDDPSLL